MRIARDPDGPQGWRMLVDGDDGHYEAETLLALAAHAGDQVLYAIRTGLLRAVPDDVFPCEALDRTFGMGDARHALDTGARPWSWFREPQIVAGFAHHLVSGRNDVPAARVLALIRAVSSIRGIPASSVPDPRDVVDVDAAAEEARVDLIVETRLRSGGKVGLVMEAKFGHQLTAGQLPNAVRHAGTRGLTRANADFIVVLPRIEDVGTRVFARQRVGVWSVISWWDLLVAYERALPPAADDEAFRSFRSLLWFHCYG